jgi:hypothetical protein
MEADEALAKLKREYPEIELHILEEALRNNDFDFRRTSEALRVSRDPHQHPDYCNERILSMFNLFKLQARFYNEEAGIPQEESLWTSLAAPFGTPSVPQTSKANTSDWDLVSFFLCPPSRLCFFI